MKSTLKMKSVFSKLKKKVVLSSNLQTFEEGVYPTFSEVWVKTFVL